MTLVFTQVLMLEYKNIVNLNVGLLCAPYSSSSRKHGTAFKLVLVPYLPYIETALLGMLNKPMVFYPYWFWPGYMVYFDLIKPSIYKLYHANDGG